MRHKPYALFALMIFSVLLFTTNSEANVHTNTFGLDGMISTDTVWDSQNLVFNNESVVITNGANLTIMNSHVNFSSFDDTGIIVDGGILNIVNSVIMEGDKCISGASNGTVSIMDSIIIGCLGDSIELVGSYSFLIDNSIVQDGGGNGIQVSDSSLSTIKNSEFKDLGKNGIITSNIGDLIISNVSISNTGNRGIRAEDAGNVDFSVIHVDNSGGDGVRSDVSGTVVVNNVEIIDAQGDGFQLENAATATIDNLLIDAPVEDGFKSSDVGTLTTTNIQVLSAGSDGYDLEYVSTVTASNIEIKSATDTGFEIDFIEQLTVTDAEVLTSGLYGFESVNITNFNVQNTNITGNGAEGIYLNNVTSFMGSGLLVSNNIGGITAINTNQASIHQSAIHNNGDFAINATKIGDGVTFDAKNNYWGTSNKDEILIFGSVDIDPILDENLEMFSKDTKSPILSWILTLSTIAVMGTIIKKETKRVY